MSSLQDIVGPEFRHYQATVRKYYFNGYETETIALDKLYNPSFIKSYQSKSRLCLHAWTDAENIKELCFHPRKKEVRVLILKCDNHKDLFKYL